MNETLSCASELQGFIHRFTGLSVHRLLFFAGTCAVVAAYAGSANYEPAAQTATITIGKTSAVVTWLGALVLETM